MNFDPSQTGPPFFLFVPLWPIDRSGVCVLLVYLSGIVNGRVGTTIKGPR